MDEALALVVAPFRDIVDKGKLAIENAADNEQMLKAAQSLVREGERALKKIEPLTKKYADEYRSNFVRGIKENEDITKYRTELNDLLWEFDDYVEADAFEQDKFSELQALSRKAAPQIYDILMRMKLEPPAPQPAPTFMSQLSPPSSPHPAPLVKAPSLRKIAAPIHPPPNVPLPPLPPLPPSAIAVTSPVRARSSTGSVRSSTPKAEDAMKKIDTSAPAPVSNRNSVVHSPHPDFASQPPPRHPERPPPPPLPSTNPWETYTKPKGDVNKIQDRPLVDRRPPVPIPDLSIDAAIPQALNFGPKSPQIRTRSNSGASDGGQDDRRPRRGNSPPSALYSVFPGPPGARSRAPTHGAPTTPVIPEDNVADVVPRIQSQEFPYSPASYSVQPRHLSQTPSIDSDFNLSSNQSIRSSAGPGHESMTTISSKSSVNLSQTPAGLELAPTATSRHMDNGLIPVISDDIISPSEAMRQAPRDTSIKNDHSFYLAKGFCAGALEVARGGIGVKKKAGINSSSAVARCTSCLYELDFNEIEKDVNRQDDGTHTQSGVEFRLRFLQKSHIAAKRNDDIPFACVFCVHAGHTVDESDATLFFTSKQLFEHLARHPRPLPDVPGITIVDTFDVPSYLRNDFDIHFMNPPAKHLAREKAIENATKPVGIARAPVRRVYGQRSLPDRTVALELAMGARVTGLTWPEKYNGEWCLGWHDGLYASVPTECVRLDVPPPQEIKVGGISSIQAKARWRFKPADEDQGDWLKFSKGEVIKNINWVYIDHWCWSGVNAKGKWGIFPQAFIDSNTIQELGAIVTDRAASIHTEKTKSTSMLSRMGIRRNVSSNRPPSVAGSTSSHETTTPGLGTAHTSPRIGRTQDFFLPGGDGL